MKKDIPVILIMILGLATAVLFCLGLTIEAASCALIALGITILGLK